MKKILGLKCVNKYCKLDCWNLLQLNKGEFEYVLVMELIRSDFRHYFKQRDDFYTSKREIYLAWLRSIGAEQPEKLIIKLPPTVMKNLTCCGLRLIDQIGP